MPDQDDSDGIIQWEHEVVERPLCEQLRAMGWEWIEGDTQVAEFTERETFRDVFLKGRLRQGLRELNLRDGEPWLDDERIEKAIKDLEGAAGHGLMDAVLFVNGLPLVVVECKSPGIDTPIHQVIDQLLRYSNQRKELLPSLYSENEGVERLFLTNQLMVATDFFESRVATVGAPPEVYLEWADTSPVPLSQHCCGGNRRDPSIQSN